MSPRILAAFTTAVLFALVVALRTSSQPTPAVPRLEPSRSEWPMFGGGVQRNFVQPFAKNLPVEWSLEPGKETNVKWSADLGSESWGHPVVAGGRIFVGTNNAKPRNPADVNEQKHPIDLAVLMCFRAADGKFLWQATHPKLATGRVNDWPRTGLVSSPAVEGDRLYYVSNRCELICARVDTGVAIWRLDMIRDLGVYPHNMSTCSPLVVGNLVFAVTSNGVDAGHLEVPAPRAPSFVAVDKTTGKAVWKDNAPTARFPAKDPAQTGAQREEMLQDLRAKGKLRIHVQWSNPTYWSAYRSMSGTG